MQATRSFEVEEVVTTKTVPVITLTLSEEEAKFLSAFSQKVGGSAATTYRGIASDLNKALFNFGIDADWSTYFYNSGTSWYCHARSN